MIEFDCSEITYNIRNFLLSMESAQKQWALSECHILEAAMKRDAPWHNITHEARRRLSASYTAENGIVDITLSHGVDYGVYLELAHKKEGEVFAPYAIIGPVVRADGKKIMASYSQFVQKCMRVMS